MRCLHHCPEGPEVDDVPVLDYLVLLLLLVACLLPIFIVR